MNYPAYPEYKESGVQWLGEVPGHWEVKRLSYLALLKSGDSITSEQIAEGGEYPVFGGNGLRGYYPEYTHEGTFILIGRQGALCGNINYASGRFWASEHAVVVNPLSLFAVKWLGELLYAMNLNQYSVSAAQPGLSVSQISSLKIPVPPSTEQTAIADFLDRETGRIDTLVGKKRRLVALLKEKRTALISHTVTCGLPEAAAREFGLEPHTRFKDSGIEWLGEVPEGWEVKKGRHIGTLLGGISPTEEEIVDEEEGAPYAKVDDLNQIDTSLILKFTKARVLGYRAPEGGFLLFPKRGAAIFTNKVAVVLKPTLFDPNLMGWRVKSSFHIKFVAYCLIARRLDDLADVSTVPQINNKHINPSGFPCPLLSEQTAITTYLDSETSKIDRLMEKVETAIARLQEYRTALTIAAVTGKIDVREAIA